MDLHILIIKRSITNVNILSRTLKNIFWTLFVIKNGAGGSCGCGRFGRATHFWSQKCSKNVFFFNVGDIFLTFLWNLDYNHYNYYKDYHYYLYYYYQKLLYFVIFDVFVRNWKPGISPLNSPLKKMQIHGFKSIFWRCVNFELISINNHQFPLFSINFHGFSLIFINSFCWFSIISISFVNFH